MKKPSTPPRGPDRKPRKPRLPADLAHDPGYQASRAESERHNARLRRIKADRAQIELAQLRGELVSREEIVKQNVRRITVMRRALLSLPRQLAPQVVGLDVRAAMGLMQTRIEQLLTEFADSDPC